MITLDVNLKYLTDHYNIGVQQLQMYRGKSLQEIMEIEAHNGNDAASKFNINIFTNPMELVRIFELMRPENRYAIIKNMNYNDKLKLLSMLEIGEMLNGIKFFQKDKILQMLQGLDKEKILKVIGQKYSMEDFLKMIPERLQNKFFDSKKISQKQILAGVQHLEPEQMARMIENITGQPQTGKDKKELMQTLRAMKPEMLKEAVKSLEQDEKAFIMFKMQEEDPKVLLELDMEALMMPLEQLNKGDLIEAMGVLEGEDLIPMLAELPEDLMAITATQIDPEKFAKLLSTDFATVLGEIGLNAA